MFADQADVIVLGGGPAGAWAGIMAARAGARVVLADKGHVGTSGATAATNTAVVDMHAHPDVLATVIERRQARGYGLVDPETVTRTLTQAAIGLDHLDGWGYGFPVDDAGRVRRHTLRGPNYMQLMRRQLRRERVEILDHHPAIQLIECDARLAGAAGIDRRTGARWSVRAPAVVIATGGCAFLSGALGTRGLTGDGLLMAAELGAELSGMEFSAQFGIAHEQSSVTKNIIYQWATFTDEDGTILQGDDVFDIVARNRSKGRVYAVIDRASAREREALRYGQPNIFVAFDRLGLDPFRQRFPVTLRHEGTVRGVGGLLTDMTMRSTVPGLFAAGDAASRESLVGATSGGGGPNATWAIGSGIIAGAVAAEYAMKHAAPVGQPPSAWPEPWRAPVATLGSTVRAAQDAVGSYVRHEAQLRRAEDQLGTLWRGMVQHSAWSMDDALKGREAAAMLATARWITRSALLREETRGMHRRSDRPETKAGRPGRWILSGTDKIHAREVGGPS